MKQVLSIQDISCVGRCSLGVALPIISACGIETCVLPTALLSCHTGFKHFSFLDLSDQIKPIMQNWKAENIHFDGIYSGFLGSQTQISLISELFKEFGKNSIKLVDPCMGDNGKLYPCFDEKFVEKMRELCQIADIVTPNITEASFLTKSKYLDACHDEKYIDDLLLALSKMGAKKIILKGITYNKNEVGVVAFDAKSKEKWQYFHELLPLKTSGTGDIFASVLFASIINGKTLQSAIQKSANFVLESIRTTLKNKDRKWYGVEFEGLLKSL
ncbi:MAG: pyridoxamine kinase [Campylobacter sp.]|nr:pyridoxamine kinase [Campylobacter sp.]